MDERDWADTPLQAGACVRIGDTEVRLLIGTERILLATGDLDAARGAIAPQAKLIGLGEEEGEIPFGIQVARDVAAFVGGGAVHLGWHPGGFAISDNSDGYVLFELEGPAAQHILAQGTNAPFTEGSPSATIRFAGVNALLTKREAAWRLRAPAAFSAYISEFLLGADPAP